MSFIHSETERIIKKHKTRNPYELLNAIGAVTRISNEYSKDGLKGYCIILNRCMYAVINGKLNETDQKIAAGHEAAHLILHKDQIRNSPAKAMRDFNLYDNSSLAEREANFFLADFIITDEEALDATMMADDYFTAASSLYIPAPLFAFKLYSMMQRGFEVRNPAELNSRFLRR